MSDFEDNLADLKASYLREREQNNERIRALEEQLIPKDKEIDALRASECRLVERIQRLEQEVTSALINIDTVQQPLLLTGPDNHIVYGNDLYFFLTGFSVEQIAGKPFSDFLRGKVSEVNYASFIGKTGLTDLLFSDVDIAREKGDPLKGKARVYLRKPIQDYNGVAFLLEPLSTGFRALLQSYFGHHHVITVREKYAPEGCLTEPAMTLLLGDCTRAYTFGEKKHGVLVDMEGVTDLPSRGPAHLTEMQKFLSDRNLQFVVTGVSEKSLLYSSLRQEGFPAEYIHERAPRKKKS